MAESTTKPPELSLIRGTEITAETLARLFEKMTGKQPTAEEIAAARAKLAERKPSP